MAHIADQLQVILDTRQELQDRIEAGHPPRDTDLPLNNVLLIGTAGTGKSMVAQKLARAFALIGVTDSSTTLQVTPKELAGEYQGQASERVLALLKKAKGGVLFIDEAHQFADNDLTEDALRALIAPMSDPKNHTLVIFGGYPGQMEKLYKVDPGLRGRFPYQITTGPYDLDDLIDIGMAHMADGSYTNKDHKAELAMENAIQAIVDNPENAAARDVKESVFRYANEARVRRTRTHKKAAWKNRLAFTAEDWDYARERYIKERNL